MCFVGQTGQGVVVPLILLITGDVLLAISVNLLNDFIAASSVAVNYVRKKQFYLSKDIMILIVIALITSFFGVFLLMLTPLSAIFGWFLPVFIIFLGTIIMFKGFPTSSSLKETVYRVSQRFLKRKKEDVRLEDIEIISENPEDIQGTESDNIESVIKPNSKLFFILAIILGIIIGLNSGMFGANSGFIITLVLIILYGYPLKKSVGTALILSIFMCLFTFSIYQILGYSFEAKLYFHWEFSLYLGIGSLLTGFIISNYVQKLSAKAMGRGMGATMILLGTFSLIFYFIS